MTAILNPIALGVVAYMVTAVVAWALSFLALPSEMAISLYPFMVTIVPLLIAGFVAAKFTKSSYRTRKVTLGVIAGLVGFSIVMWTADMPWALRLMLAVVAALIAAVGSLIGARAGYAS